MLSLIFVPTIGTKENLNAKENAISNPELLEIIKERQVLYEATFPEIKFVVLTEAEAWINDISRLVAILGFEPSNLDYEHPIALRQTLMEVSIERLIRMTKRKMASATLFKTDKPLESRRNVCVLTLNPTTLASSDATATRHLLDISDSEFSKIPMSHYLNRRDYLRYVFDHEAFHCLDSFYSGPQPMSMEPYWGRYHHYRHELGADAYSVGVYIRSNNAISSFVKSLFRLRRTSLYGGYIDHRTCDAIQEISKIGVAKLSKMSFRELLQTAISLRNRLAPDYESYLRYRRAAAEAIRILNSAETSVIEDIPDVPIDKALVEKLVTQAATCRAPP